MKNTFLIPQSAFYLLVISVSLIIFQMFTGLNYPVFRDEFYYIDCANHPAFGYVDHPPLSVFILYLWKSVFGTSQLSLRIIPAMCQAATVYLSGVITSQMGGSKYAQVIAALITMFVPNYLGTAGFYSMNAFDILIWAVMFVILLKILSDDNTRLFILLGAVAGIGLQNKISAGFFIAAMLPALLFTKQRKYFLSGYLYAGLALCGLIFLPYIVWNFQNDFASLEFISNASKYKISDITPLNFFTAQILEINPLYFIFWFTGLIFLLFSKTLNKFQVAGLIYIFTFLILALQNSKPYYLAASYTPLIAAGSLLFADIIAVKKLDFVKKVLPALIIIAGLIISPFAVPLLSPQKFIDYSQFLGITPQNAERNQLGALPQHFADRFGWEELTDKVAKIYNSLPDNEKLITGIFAQNYGETGAINYYGKKYNLPECNSGHNNHWLWGPRHDSLETFIIIGGGDEDDHLESFEEVVKMYVHTNQFAMLYENNLPVFLCRKIRKPIKEIWKETKLFI